MKNTDSIAEKLANLKKLRDDLRSGDAILLLRQALGDRSNRIVQRAADILGEAAADIGDSDVKPIIADLLSAYGRLEVNPLKKDPGCAGKTAIIRALVRLGHDDAEIYRRGVEYEQPEPIWGRRKDTAAELRGLCALGLVASVRSIEVLNRCAVLLVDEYAEARAGAAQALAALAAPEGASLLRLKLLTGDKAPEVVGECCSAILRLEREAGVDFVVTLLSSENPDVCVHAGLALGDSRLLGAFAPLKSAWEQRFEQPVRESLLLCIGLLRSTEARDFLLSLIDTRNLRAADDAIKALKMCGQLGDVREKSRAAVEATGDARLANTFVEEWGNEPPSS